MGHSCHQPDSPEKNEAGGSCGTGQRADKRDNSMKKVWAAPLTFSPPWNLCAYPLGHVCSDRQQRQHRDNSIRISESVGSG